MQSFQEVSLTSTALHLMHETKHKKLLEPDSQTFEQGEVALRMNINPIKRQEYRAVCTTRTDGKTTYVPM